MNEELKIKVTLDTSGVDAGKAKVKKSLQSLGDSTKKSLKGATTGATEGFEELRNSIDRIKNLQFADMISKQLDKIKGHLDNVSDYTKLTFSYLGDSFKNFKGFTHFAAQAKKSGLTYQKAFAKALKDKSWTDLKTSLEGAKEGIREFGNAGKAALEAVHAKLLLVVGAVVALGAAIKNSINTASQIKTLNNEAQKIGMSINGYQEWAYVMEKTGSDADTLADAIKTLSAEQLEVRKGTEDVIETFNALGLSAEQVTNMSQEQLFTETVKRLQNVRNEVERTSLAYRIFGEDDAAQMANVLRLTNEETAEMASMVHLLGNTISGDLLTKSTALSGAISNMKMAWQGLSRTLGELFMPIITTVVNALTKAMVVVNLFLKTIFGLDITPAASSIGAATGGVGSLSNSLSDAGNAANKTKNEVEKLKRATMGFDELNIVSAPVSSSSGSGGAGSGAGAGGIDLGTADFDIDESAFDKAKGKIEEFQKKVQDFLDKWKTEIQIIAAALGALALTKIITDLGKAIGLGEKFLGTMGTIKKLGWSAIVITLQYSLVNDFMDKFIDGEGVKNYISGLITAAIGTGILYKMWDAKGLVIGLAVTAVASISAVIDNGGITNIESAVTALTGLAAGIGAVVAAWKLLGPLGGAITIAVEAIALLVMGLRNFINEGPNVQNTILIIGGAIGVALALATGGVSVLVSAIVGAVTAIVAFTAAILLEKPAIQSVEEAQRSLTEAKEAAAAAENSYINAVDAAEASLKKLEDAEKRTGLSGKALYDQVQDGTLDYKNMTDAQKEVYKAYIDNEKKQKDLEKSTKEYNDAKKAETLASYEHQLALAKESGSYDEFKKSVIAAFKEGTLSADEARDLLAKSMSEMSNDSQKTFMEDIPGDIKEGLDPHQYESTGTKLKKWFSDRWQDIKNVFGDAKTWFSTKVSEIWTTITKWWNQKVAPKFTKKYWQDKFSSIKEGLKSAINGAIGVVENGVNFIIKKINTLSWTIPDWVPKIGGGKFGFNFKTISIPRLATGGIAINSTLANIGENGREAVLPLDNNTGWMDMLADRIAARNANPTKVILKVGERELGEATIQAINQNTRMNGGLRLQLV